MDELLKKSKEEKQIAKMVDTPGIFFSGVLGMLADIAEEHKYYELDLYADDPDPVYKSMATEYGRLERKLRNLAVREHQRGF